MPQRPRWSPALCRWPRSLRYSAGLHAAAATLAAAVPHAWPWAALLIAGNHLLLGGAGLMPGSGLLGPNLRRLAARAPAVALTFDDGPDPLVTPRVLDLLDRAGARATFFLIGEAARRHPDLVATIALRGHGIGNHTLSHPALFAALGPGGMRREIVGAQRVLGGLLGWSPRLFRAPMGFRSPLLAPLLQQEGLRLVSWTRRALDGREVDPARGAARLLGGLAPGDILLMHDGRPAPARAGQAPAALILPLVLDALRARGLSTVLLPGARPAAAPAAPAEPAQDQPDMHPGQQQVVARIPEV